MSLFVDPSQPRLQALTQQLHEIHNSLTQKTLLPADAERLIDRIEKTADKVTASTKHIQEFKSILEITKRQFRSMAAEQQRASGAASPIFRVTSPSPSWHSSQSPQQATHQHSCDGTSHAVSPFFFRAASSSPPRQRSNPNSHQAAHHHHVENVYNQDMARFAQQLSDIESSLRIRLIPIEEAFQQKKTIESQANKSRKKASKESVSNYDKVASRLTAYLQAERRKKSSDLDGSYSERPHSSQTDFSDEEKQESPKIPNDPLSNSAKRLSDLGFLVDHRGISYEDAIERFNAIVASSTPFLSNAADVSMSAYTDSILSAQQAISRFFQANQPKPPRNRRPSRSVSPHNRKAAAPPLSAHRPGGSRFREPARSVSPDGRNIQPPRPANEERRPVVRFGDQRNEAQVRDFVLPDEIDIQDPLYHPICRDLSWDTNIILKYLREMNDGAKSLMKRQKKYVHPQEVQKVYAGFTDFALIGATRRERDNEIESRIVNSSRGVVACEAKVVNSSGISSIFSGKVRLQNEQKHPYEVYARFDGIGGNETALFANDLLQTYLEEELVAMNPNGITFAGICNAFRATFFRLDQEAKSNIPDKTGCSILVSLKIRIGEKEYLFTANAGDSRGVMRIGRDHLIQLSIEAIPTAQIEGIEDQNPYNIPVIQRGGEIIDGKVQGQVPVTKGLNYSHLAEGCTYYPIDFVPDITCHELPRGEEIYLALVSRETWRRASSYDVITLLGSDKDKKIERDAFRIMRATLITADDGPCDASILAVKLASNEDNE